MKKLTEDLFTFPIVMVDAENEERKEKDEDRFGDISGKEKESAEYDIIYGEASYPYFEFAGCEDRWLPTRRSLQRALKQKFDACIVRFNNAGQFLVPMNKEKFTEAINVFAEKREKDTTEEPAQNDEVDVTVITLSQLLELAKQKNEKG